MNSKLTNIENVNQQSVDLSLRLASLRELFLKEDDTKNAEKLNQLVDKVQSNEFIIGFCGHFSAGKSSMMNELMKEEVLPSSPIPTSANLVKVKAGRPYARVFYKNGEPLEFPEPYDYDIVKNYCMDGDAIESIEISKSNLELPEGITIMDTPGIDSTDDAHRIATESALHLADIIFYVMDYNHVQSEQNFLFTKMLKDRNKSVYLVINQIDKHNNAELDFNAFKESVLTSFKDWSVEPDGIFYTSLKERSHPENELSDLESLVGQKMDQRKELLIKSVLTSVDQLVKEHIIFKENTQQKSINTYESELNQIPHEEIRDLSANMEDIETQIRDLDLKDEKFKSDFKNGLTRLLDNAYLMPAHTREKARAFVEACQPDFKVGLLFAKKKTEQEKEKRLDAFYKDLVKQVEAQLDWQIKDFLSTFMKSYEIHDENLLQEIYELRITIPKNLLLTSIKEGAGFTGDYILTYTKDVANEIKRIYRASLEEIFEKALSVLNNTIQKQMSGLKEQLNIYTSVQHAKNNLEAFSNEINAYKELLSEVKNGNIPSSIKEAAEKWLLVKQSQKKVIKKQVMEIKPRKKEHETTVNKIEQQQDSLHEETNIEYNVEERVKSTIEKLKKSTDLLHGISGFKTISNDMDEKAKRLQNNQFTIALFGAFSAGKSSFANALMGGNILPVSPNPTTATINKILPPNEQNTHGTVKVKIKTEKQLLNDIKHSLKVFDKEAKSLSAAIKVISKLSYDSNQNESKEKTHYSFLKAVIKGLQDVQDLLGTIVTVDLQGFRDYVAKEEKACFVEWIELYYDCPLTREGVTLVDTPGADSINARHTGVAFEYIKNADAVLFVTYYNHAFSKADREFLIQLGRVKEAFELDKMFFIVNAADLASSDEEMGLVTGYVSDQLIEYGIRQPRIYPISSKNALAEKISNTKVKTSGIDIFEKDFKTFIIKELTEIAIQTAYQDMKRAQMLLIEIINNAKESDHVKKEKLEKAKNEEKEINGLIASIETTSEFRALDKEVEELLYYVKQRIQFRFNETFNESFNPSALRDDGRDLKNALNKCFIDLLEFIGFNLSQEMRATSLRLEKFLNKKLHEIFKKVERETLTVNHSIQLLPFEDLSLGTIDFSSELTDVNEKSLKEVLSSFKSPKSFFEQGGKNKMKEKMEELLHEPISNYVLEQNTRLKQYFNGEFEKEIDQLITNALGDVKEYYQGIAVSLSETIDIDHFEAMKQEIGQFIK